MESEQEDCLDYRGGACNPSTEGRGRRIGSSQAASTTSQFKNYMRPSGKRIEKKEREERGMDKNKREREREEIKEERGRRGRRGNWERECQGSPL